MSAVELNKKVYTGKGDQIGVWFIFCLFLFINNCLPCVHCGNNAERGTKANR